MNLNTVIQKTHNSSAKLPNDNQVNGDYVTLDGEEFYRIANSHLMPEFFMSMTTSSDHWMFITSYGALTAGRKDPNNALFPYYSADKISDMSATTGPKTVIRIRSKEGHENWTPFESQLMEPGIKRNLYKNAIGNRLIFEEIHSRFQLCFRYEWTFGHRFGFVRACQLKNFGGPRQMEILDGLQNVMPHGVDQNFQTRFSNLADAYKKNELRKESGIGIFYLSSVPTDQAKPSEGLRSTVVWQTGFEQPTTLLCENQIQSFLTGDDIHTETDIRGRRGCYFVYDQVNLQSNEIKRWKILANINQDQTDIANLEQFLLSAGNVENVVNEDVTKCQHRLLKIVSTVDGRQVSENELKTNRHQSNVLFNVMRGGFPARGYEIETDDFVQQVRQLNSQLFERQSDFLAQLPASIQHIKLIESLEGLGDSDLLRIGLEYLPFTFGRRHGDPTRPWNTFSISTLTEDETPTLEYQGNWRDIFQNWETTSHSYSHFAASMVFRFVNASTADGYNPYRVTKQGFEWESPDPADPWANFGYWGDHQIIYLLKLLETAQDFHPSKLNHWLQKDVCRYANVPYRIRSYRETLRNSQSTIDFEFDLEAKILERVAEVGHDGKLLLNRNGDVCRVNLAEKLLVTALTKMSNFVPGGGIWLNTQRPEWNDANNALVGRGLSMVTACYLRRFFSFMIRWFENVDLPSFLISREVHTLFESILQVLENHAERLITTELSGQHRKQIVEELSKAASDYRESLYNTKLSGEKSGLDKDRCLEFFGICLRYLDDTIIQNRRKDGLYHSYNLLTKIWDDNGNCVSLEIETLYEMLEGQVAVLSSGLLNAKQSLEVLDQLRASDMYREDQCSYTLYPDRRLSAFMDKNVLPETLANDCDLIRQLLTENQSTILRRDCNGQVHFNGDIRNGEGLREAMRKLQSQRNREDKLTVLIDNDGEKLVDAFEQMFDHARFTGRSGTFFGYEGLGSIYWHMVSKLLLAVAENFVTGCEDGEATDILARLKSHFREIQNGIAIEKTPVEYGAFPTDPYSHTPGHAGVQQPGMTGQVKEDILARFIELGIRMKEGKLHFDFQLFDPSEYLTEAATHEHYDLAGNWQCKVIEPNCVAFTFCQTPVIYRSTLGAAKIELNYQDGSSVERDATYLTLEETRQLLSRTGQLKEIEVHVPRDELS